MNKTDLMAEINDIKTFTQMNRQWIAEKIETSFKNGEITQTEKWHLFEYVGDLMELEANPELKGALQ